MWQRQHESPQFVVWARRHCRVREVVLLGRIALFRCSVRLSTLKSAVRLSFIGLVLKTVLTDSGVMVWVWHWCMFVYLVVFLSVCANVCFYLYMKVKV